MINNKYHSNYKGGEFMKSNTATFIGHRNCYGLDVDKLKIEIESLIKRGVTEFLSGGMGEFDRISARIVYDLKKKYPYIKNNLVIPYLNFKVFNEDLFDELILPEAIELMPPKLTIFFRNHDMVDNSQYAICFVKHNTGGAASTYKYALRKDLEVINLAI